jgi:hypothetical protein
MLSEIRCIEQHEELQDWVGHDYGPDTFSIEGVNQCSRLCGDAEARSDAVGR